MRTAMNVSLLLSYESLYLCEESRANWLAVKRYGNIATHKVDRI